MIFENLELINNMPIHNFELFVKGERAFIDYKTKNNKFYLVHTEVPAALQGMGVAEAMVKKTFNYIDQHGQKIVPLCTYIKVFLKRHPEWSRLVT